MRALAARAACENASHCHARAVNSRRAVGAGMLIFGFSLPTLPALALGDSTVTLEDVTPPVAPRGDLPPSEERIAKLFENNTFSVVNVFDTTLKPELNLTGSVEVPEGNGTGIVWDKDGHIVTNYHVIGSALSKGLGKKKPVARVSLLVEDGVQKTFQATLVGADKTKDLAVLKIDAPEALLHPISVGKSSNLKVGQRCLAIGNPFGFDHTLTVGVVSGLNRDINSQTGVIIGGGIQTDAAINPGNSGGPLLNSDGKLIGINAAIFTRTGTSAGIGFAIPVDAVSRVVPQLIKYGKIMHAGLKIQVAPDIVAKQLNVKKGSLVLSVLPSSTAAKAGLVATRRGIAGNILLGDVILAVDNLSIKNPAELAKALDDHEIGDQVVLKVQRDDKVFDIHVELEESLN
ncbi:hypothetical protein SELMODRAFT_422439 [Selaginella moellendorffii]|uniref:PDZ domain-containing protein n=1 Tax=Selaginella moellendorffii TaxID=88036 RepID=D8SIE5_SELML|nr:protease Do-like 8, chloroplastic [Selaginella moellendorffii]XP_024543782.1 protease Do-like 8, chloroplastic [Selaginella moellendorffii]EFJ15956.1 hypothetical protein SELMODRAFT_422439 [Selaginella moellendorffii]|eukprot:XP_002983147.1 protease Do-like 8, chloroplastic [Selaginella moellendorffii]